MMKTYSAKPSEVEKKWYLIDAEGVVLGRLASQIAVRLRGKHKPIFTPHIDCGDNIIVINAEKVALTGNKWETKVYTRYSGYPGLKSQTAGDRLAKRPEMIIREAVRRMLPKNKLGRKMLLKLKIFVGPDHSHQAQQPETIELPANG